MESAVELLREKLRQRTFQKATGRRVVEAIDLLVKYWDCGGCLTERDVAELVNNFYIFESRLRNLLELYDKLSRGGLRAVLRELYGEEPALPPVEYDLLLRELDRYRNYLFQIASRVSKCHSSTNSRA